MVAAMPAAPQLAVQIVNYHTRNYLERCLDGVAADLEQSGLQYEISLLDNGSGERLGDLSQRYLHCRAFMSAENLGFGGGHNLLARQTRARHLLILNPDIEFLAPHTAERLLEVFRSDSRVKVVGPRLITAAERPQPYDHGRLHGLRASIALRGGHSYWRVLNTRQEVAWVSGAAMLLQRTAFMSVGGFDENLFLYKEDEDLCLRLRAAGALVMYEPSVVIRHHGSVVADRNAELARALSYYFAKHYPNRRSQRAFAAAHQWLAYLRL
jgi:GT2 family glycosyltransferase